MEGTQKTLFARFAESISSIDSPRQLSLGLCIGTVIGLMPKENLIVAGLLVLLVVSVANLVTGTVAAIAASTIAPMLESTFHQIGLTVLESEAVLLLLSRAYEIPLMPWTCLDNTVVTGSFVFGSLIFLPIYLTGFYLFHRSHDLMARTIGSQRIVRWLQGPPPAESRTAQS